MSSKRNVKYRLFENTGSEGLKRRYSPLQRVVRRWECSEEIETHIQPWNIPGYRKKNPGCLVCKGEQITWGNRPRTYLLHVGHSKCDGGRPLIQVELWHSISVRAIWEKDCKCVNACTVGSSSFQPRDDSTARVVVATQNRSGEYCSTCNLNSSHKQRLFMFAFDCSLRSSN